MDIDEYDDEKQMGFDEQWLETYSESQLKPWVTPTITEFDFNKETGPLD